MKNKHLEIQEAKKILREQNMEEVEEARARDEDFIHPQNQIHNKVADLLSFIVSKGLLEEYIDYNKGE